MIETIENLASLVNHFFHKEEGFRELRICKHCWDEYLASSLIWVWATEWEVVLWLKCWKCWTEDVIQLSIAHDMNWKEIENEIAESTTVEDLLWK